MRTLLQSSPTVRKTTVLLAFSTVLLAAFLLFVLELAVAKALLPRFGGSPMVWTTSMLVYQVLLLAGYAYAHGLAGCRFSRWQPLVHMTILFAAVALAWWRLKTDVLMEGDPAAISRRPFIDLLAILLGTLGLPFIAVSATSPLVQHWYQRLGGGQTVYRLYAVSNAGSFAALVSYPFIIEPLLSVDRQLALWSALFSLLALGLCALGVQVRVSGRSAACDGKPDESGPADSAKSGAGPIFWWVGLPAATSALLLAGTNELCQDLAVFPFLWVMPLALYLLSFTLTFRGDGMRDKTAAGAVVTVVVLSTTAASLMLPAPVHVIAINTLVFVLCTAVHRELYRLRPSAERLTAYYLWIALGSGIGAMAVALAAPLLFTGYWEFQIVILVLWTLLTLSALRDPAGCLRRGSPRHAIVLLAVATYMLVNQVPEEWLLRSFRWWPGEWSLAIRLALVFLLVCALWSLFLRGRKGVHSVVWPRVLAGLVIFLAECAVVQRVRNDLGGSESGSRNFFGVVRTREVLHASAGIRIRQLTHGRINHGWQYVNPELRRLPTSYHSPSSGIGTLLRLMQAEKDSLRIGVTGLGAGALAAYPRESDTIVFYEIDPAVVRLAYGTDAAFSFLNECPGEYAVVLGDARQSMRRELLTTGPRSYDVLALDAFSSDAIPMHLLTREAFELYFNHLARDGVLAVNISNRFLDVEPVLAGVAQSFGLQAVLVDSNGDPPVRARSLWVLLSRGTEMLRARELADVSRALKPAAVSWTDNSCSPFALMKWWNVNARYLRFSWKRRHGSEVKGVEPLPSQKP